MTELEMAIFQGYTENLGNELARLLPVLNSSPYYEKAVEMLVSCREAGNRIHVSGIGKPHYLAGYFASLLSSIGYPAYLLDGTEATHGSSGQVVPGDVAVMISYYGNPQELVKTAATLKKLGTRMIAVTGFDLSPIAKMADVHLNVYVPREGDPLGKPPRLSMLITMICLQNLSVLLQGKRNLTLEDYIQWHPNGEIGNCI